VLKTAVKKQNDVKIKKKIVKEKRRQIDQAVANLNIKTGLK